MRIAICDDIPAELKKMCFAVELYGKKHNIKFDISTYNSAITFLKAIKNSGDFDAALLDVCMPDMSGIEAAKHIRSLDPKTKIIFLTTSRDYAVEAFSLAAAHYLIKPISSEQFEEAMDRIFGANKEKKLITVRCDEELRTVELDMVEFFEVRGHRLYIFLSDGEQICLRQTLCAIREQIGDNASFACCGASYIVNLACVKKMTSAVLTMMCGANIPVPRRVCSQLEKQYLDYYRREAAGT